MAKRAVRMKLALSNGVVNRIAPFEIHNVSSYDGAHHLHCEPVCVRDASRLRARSPDSLLTQIRLPSLSSGRSVRPLSPDPRRICPTDSLLCSHPIVSIVVPRARVIGLTLQQKCTRPPILLTPVVIRSLPLACPRRRALLRHSTERSSGACSSPSR